MAQCRPEAAVAAANGAAPGDTAKFAALAQREYANRRRRDTIFGDRIFAEPAWDMLLDLYVQRHLGRPVSIQSLCIAAAVPQTTALRWIARLVVTGLATRQPCREDQRVVHVALSPRGVAEMEDYLGHRLRQAAADGAEMTGRAQ